jgi:hypothetical protein
MMQLEGAPAVIEQAETTMLFDIATLVNAVYQLVIEPTKEGRVPKRITKKLYPLLKGIERSPYMNDDDLYMDMLFEIMNILHIIKVVAPPVDSMKPRIEVGGGLTAWAEQDIAGQTRILLDHWQKNPRWEDVGELSTYNEQVDDDGGNISTRSPFEAWDWGFSTDILAGRTTLLAHLHEHIPGQWYNVNALLRDIWQANPLGSRRSMSAQARKTEERKAKESYKRWYNYNAINYISMLSSSLHELGIIDLGLKKIENEDDLMALDAFCITPLGAQMLGSKGAQIPDMTGTTSSSSTPDDANKTNTRSLIVQPSFEILQLQHDLPTLYRILPFTQVKQISVASQFMLSQTALHRGIAAGKTVAQVIQILEEHSQKELPQNVLYTLQDWAKLYKETRLSMVMLIEAPNESVAKHIASQTRFQRWNVRELAPCILALNGDANPQEVRNALEKIGVTIHFIGNFPKSSKSNSDGYY